MNEVPKDPANPGFDVLIGKIGARTHYIHCVLANTSEPLSAEEIGQRAETLARAAGYQVRERTFSPSTTWSHLRTMRDNRDRGFVEQVDDGRWQLTESARRRINAASRE